MKLPSKPCSGPSRRRSTTWCGVSKARNRASRAASSPACARATRTSGTAKATVMSERYDATTVKNVAGFLNALRRSSLPRMASPDVREWLHHWQDQADAAYLYLALAGQEADPHKKDVYIKLAGEIEVGGIGLILPVMQPFA